MTIDTGYYALVRATDPTYFTSIVVKEYMRDNPDVAESLVLEYVDDLSDLPFDFDGLEDYFNGMSPFDAFQCGLFTSPSQFSMSDDYFDIDGYGHPVSLTQDDYDSRILDILEDQLMDKILEGKIDIPEELREVLSFWWDGQDGLKRAAKMSGIEFPVDDYYWDRFYDDFREPGSSKNRKPTASKNRKQTVSKTVRKPAKRTIKKAPAKAKPVQKRKQAPKPVPNRKTKPKAKTIVPAKDKVIAKRAPAKKTGGGR